MSIEVPARAKPSFFLQIVLYMITLHWIAAGAHAETRVVTSIKPVHSLASAIMEGAGAPHLIVDGAGSPHTYALRPSDATALQEADIVFWVGGELELFLAEPLEALTGDARQVPLSAAPGVNLRLGGSGHHDEDHGSSTSPGGGEVDDAHGPYDLHIWLDPRNAAAMADEMVRVLSVVDPHGAETYGNNAAALKARLDGLDDELKRSLGDVASVPFIAYHDGFGYLVDRYGLNMIGFVTATPHQQPGAERIRALQEAVREAGAVCAFSEPQFRSAVLDIVIEGSAVRVGTIDPLGSDIDAGAEQYFGMMRANAAALRACLSPSG